MSRTEFDFQNLNGWFNPKENQQEALMKLDLVKESNKYDREYLFELRIALVKKLTPELWSF